MAIMNVSHSDALNSLNEQEFENNMSKSALSHWCYLINLCHNQRSHNEFSKFLSVSFGTEEVGQQTTKHHGYWASECKCGSFVFWPPWSKHLYGQNNLDAFESTNWKIPWYTSVVAILSMNAVLLTPISPFLNCVAFNCDNFIDFPCIAIVKVY